MGDTFTILLQIAKVEIYVFQLLFVGLTIAAIFYGIVENIAERKK